jgi:hypothetical protein
VKVLEAAVFGDERSFIVPTGGGNRIRERLIAEPDVYLDPNLVPMDDAAVEAWRAFLRKCLLLDADKRLQSAHAFADALENLLARHPIQGRRVVSGLAGRLVRRAQGEGLMSRMRAFAGGDDHAVVWMVSDSYAHARETPWQVSFDLAAE